MSRDIFGYHDAGERGPKGLYWVEVRYAAKHPIMNKAGPKKKELSILKC